MNENATSPRVLGCDVGKDSVVIFDSLTATTQTVKNTVAALTRALDHLERDTLLVCEATGGYETALLTTAVTLGLPVHRGDPRKISAFLRSLRGHGKTDTLDARGSPATAGNATTSCRAGSPRPRRNRRCVSWSACAPTWWPIAPTISAA